MMENLIPFQEIIKNLTITPLLTIDLSINAPVRKRNEK